MVFTWSLGLEASKLWRKYGILMYFEPILKSFRDIKKLLKASMLLEGTAIGSRSMRVL